MQHIVQLDTRMHTIMVTEYHEGANEKKSNAYLMPFYKACLS